MNDIIKLTILIAGASTPIILMIAELVFSYQERKEEKKWEAFRKTWK